MYLFSSSTFSNHTRHNAPSLFDGREQTHFNIKVVYGMYVAVLFFYWSGSRIPQGKTSLVPLDFFVLSSTTLNIGIPYSDLLRIVTYPNCLI